MTNYKEIIRLHSSGDYSNREIAKILGVSRNTISSCLEKIKEKGMAIPLPEAMSNEEISAILFPKKERVPESSYMMPNFEHLVEELKRPHVTKKLLWKEYVSSCVNSGLKTYSISQFNSLLNEYARSNSISMTRERTPGEVLELDWSGSSIDLKSKVSDVVIKCHLFVAAFPFSGYFFAEAFQNEKVHCWTQGISDSLTFFGGVPVILRPDNCKTATIKADKYEPELNQAMIELSEYYETVTIPARVKKPRDKNVVESAVGFASRNIIAALRNQVFYSIEELNKTILSMVEKLNEEPFNKKPGNRYELFTVQEKPCLLPLPSKPFTLFERATAKVAPDFHVQFAKCFYSVHPKYIGEIVRIRASLSDIEIMNAKGDIIAKHKRVFTKGQKVTDSNHIPESHREVLGWSGDKFRSEAKKIGPKTLELIESVLSSRQFEVQSFRVCRGILNLRFKFGREALELAADNAVSAGIRSYKGVKALVETMDIGEEDKQGSSTFDESCFFITHESKEVH